MAVRRLKRGMGLTTLLDALALVVSTQPDVLLALGGAGPLRSELKARVEALGLARNVRFIGYVAAEDLLMLYRAADASVGPTEALEGFGLFAADSLAAGMPAPVTAVGSLPEVVTGLSPTLVIPAASASAMSSHLVGALRGDIGLPDMNACESYAADMFAVTTVAARLAVYRKVLSNG